MILFFDLLFLFSYYSLKTKILLNNCEYLLLTYLWLLKLFQGESWFCFKVSKCFILIGEVMGFRF